MSLSIQSLTEIIQSDDISHLLEIDTELPIEDPLSLRIDGQNSFECFPTKADIQSYYHSYHMNSKEDIWRSTKPSFNSNPISDQFSTITEQDGVSSTDYNKSQWYKLSPFHSVPHTPNFFQPQLSPSCKVLNGHHRYLSLAQKPSASFGRSANTPKFCSISGCTRQIRSRGLCKSHGGGRRCKVPGCEKGNQGQGKCIAHGGGKRCSFPGCKKSVQTRGLCKSHGGGIRCQFNGCGSFSQGNGFCRRHGGGKKCMTDGCNKGRQRGGYCAKHGVNKVCLITGCTKIERGGGYCVIHGGNKRCSTTSCTQIARIAGYCLSHQEYKMLPDASMIS